MSEDDLRARLDRIDTRIEDRLNKTDEKIDDLRRELQSSSKLSHQQIYKRIEAVENENAENRHILAAMKEHLEQDTPFESGWRSKVYQVAIFILTSGVGAFFAILAARWTK